MSLLSQFKRFRIPLLCVVIVAVGMGLRQAKRSWDRVVRQRSQAEFKETVSPMLRQSCIRCHGAESQKGQLRLDTLAGALKGGASGPALVPGDPDRSLMLTRAMHNDPMREIPPKDPPTDADLAGMRRWIEDGAQWVEKKERADGEKKVASGKKGRLGDAWTDSRNPVVKAFKGKRLDLWSLKPIANPQPPVVKETQWARNDLDRFILARMESVNVRPAPEATSAVLARRLYFGLTGLPPTPEQMQAFLADKAPDAYNRLVAELLDSHEYGEHWARFWLDVVRYSDSNGFDYDEFRPNAWRFRDYVVRAFNSDKPYDRLLREHLAGDEMVEGAPRNQDERDALSGTGYLRVGPYDNSAARFGEKDRCRAQVMSDLVETTGAVFLGLNLVCSKCHDHKIDPFIQADYYRLRAFFEPSKMTDDVPLDIGPQADKIKAETLAIERAGQAVRDVENPVFRRLRAEKRAALPEDKRKLLATPVDELSEFMHERVRLIKAEAEPTLDEVIAAFSSEEKAAHAQAKAALETLQKQRTAPQLGYVVTDAVAGPFETRLLHQGDYQKPEDYLDSFARFVRENPEQIEAIRILLGRPRG